MRDKFATVAAVFVPLAFIGSAVFWAVVFLLVRPKH
jgi:hypothetical protein